jgi:hypothetical protein
MSYNTLLLCDVKKHDISQADVDLNEVNKKKKNSLG